MSTDKSQRHNKRMQRHKEVVDAKIEQADIERGVVIVITGNGKGKTTSALGTLLRSLGHGHHCTLVQFIKGQWDCGETRFCRSVLFFKPQSDYIYHGHRLYLEYPRL